MGVGDFCCRAIRSAERVPFRNRCRLFADVCVVFVCLFFLSLTCRPAGPCEPTDWCL